MGASVVDLGAFVARRRATAEAADLAETSVDRAVIVADCVLDVTQALEACGGNAVDAALWAMADLLEDASDWTPQEIANAAAALNLEVHRRNRQAGR